ncbi:MAG: ABC transporter permease [Dysgonamonadaceae bacterium]|jgi:putative ABC transport system permease protein|nr:ABC transporter permease [Dysgonamonadaceae bacterium]
MIKNFLFVLKRFKTSSILNIAGLSVALAAFIAIMIQVRFEYHFDRCHPYSDRIYRVDMLRDGEPISILPRAFADAIIASSPHIQAATIIAPLDSWRGNVYISTGEAAESKGFREPFETCYPEITQVFGFTFTEGDPQCLQDPEKVIIPQSMAFRMFGNEPATGKSLHLKETLWTKGNQDLTVGGVYKDFPGNTQIKNVIYTQIDASQKNDWMSQNYILYLLFDADNEADSFESNFNQTFDFSPLNSNYLVRIDLTPLRDIYFSQTGFRSGNENTVRILFAIALLILIIAAINYMNFSIAMAPGRIRSLNTQKILGSSTAALRVSLVSEAVILAVVSWAIALFLLFFLAHNNRLFFFDADMDLRNNLSLVILTGGIALFTGFLAGLYPAFYATAFQPALVLNGHFGLSPAGRKLRTGLIGFQYIISMGLIIAAIFMQKQNRFLQNYNQGFDKEQIAIVQLNNSLYDENKEFYVNQLKEYSGIEEVAFSKQKLGAFDSYTSYAFQYNDKMFGGYTLEVSDNFLNVMHIPVTEGRTFMPSDTTGSNLVFVLNKPLQKDIGISAGETIEMLSWGNPVCQVVGIAGEVKFTSLRQGEDPVLFLFGSSASLPVSYIRLKAGTNLSDAMNYIHKTVAGIDPTFPVKVEFYDQVLNDLYQKEVNLNISISLLSVLAIIISIAGVFGLVLFETQYRRKEIGIRKVFGSTTQEILTRFNREYFRILGVCFVIAAPAAGFGVHRWLENFAYKTELSGWIYLVAFLIVFVLTALTVTFQHWKAANANPADSIKND